MDSGHSAFQLSRLHKHYTDVLFDAIKKRCGGSLLPMTCQRLEQFFGAMKQVYDLHQERVYSRADPGKSCVWWKPVHEFVFQNVHVL